MKTAGIFAEVFTGRTTGRRAVFTITNLSLDAVKIVLKGTQVKYDTAGADEDERAGYLRRVRKSGYYGGEDGYMPTAKGYREIMKTLNANG